MIFFKCIFNLYLFSLYGIGFQAVFTIKFPNCFSYFLIQLILLKGVGSSERLVVLQASSFQGLQGISCECSEACRFCSGVRWVMVAFIFLMEQMSANRTHFLPPVRGDSRWKVVLRSFFVRIALSAFSSLSSFSSALAAFMLLVIR